MPRRVPLTRIATLAAVLAAPLGGGLRVGADDLDRPPPDAIFVKTELVPATGEVPAGLVRTTGLPVTFDFVEDQGFPVGEMIAGERHIGMALLRGRGPEAALIVDLNGDGKATRDGESFPVSVAPWMVKEQAIGLTWRATVAWGAGSFALTIQDRIGALTGQWTAEAAAEASADASADAAAGAARSKSPEALSFEPEAPASVTKPPNTVARVRYASLTVGDRPVVVAALRGAKDEMTFLVESDGGGDLSDLARRIPATAQPLKRGTIRTGTSWTTAPIEIAGVKGVLSALETLPTIQGKADPTASRSGTAKVAGDPWTLVLLDGDFDGAYTGGADWWAFMPSSSVDNPNPSKLFEGDSPCWRDASKAWRLLGVRADGTAVLAPLSPAPSVEAYLRARCERVEIGRWFPKFEAGRDEFVKAQGLDATRALAGQPCRWRHALTLDDAKALAKAEGKPLLVDFEADWCVWCKRLDWIIYPDGEVADRLAKFTAVKINVELDPTGGFQSIDGLDGEKWGAMPAIGVFDADGRPVSFKPTWARAKAELVDHIDGFKKPEEFVAALDAAYAAVSEGRMAGGAGGAGANGTVTPGPPAPGMDGDPK